MKIYQIIPEIKGIEESPVMTGIAGAVFFTVTVIVAVLIANYAAKRWKGNKKKILFGFIGISALIAVLLFAFFGFTARAVRGIILCHILLLSSYTDIKTRECDDWLHVMILLAAFIGTDLSALSGMIAGGIFVSGIILLAVVCGNTDIGGADIKLASASAFLLGIERGVIGFITGLLIAIICNLIKRNKKGFPLLPYLSAAFMAAYFL